MNIKKKKKTFERRRLRIRKKIQGTAEKPRLSVRFTNKHIYAQCINDDVVNGGLTLAALSTLSAQSKELNIIPNVEGAAKFGKLFGELAKSKGVNAVVFDRGGRRYHGRLKIFADAVRAAELNF